MDLIEVKGMKYGVRIVELEDLEQLEKLEAESYPADEAATPQKLELRAKQASDLFLVAFDPMQNENPIVAYACATLAAGELTEESMAAHDPQGDNVCIHSVVVQKQLRRNGLGSAVLEAFIRHVEKVHSTSQKFRNLKRFSLLAKKHLCTFYIKCGFELIGPSPVEHGAEQWFELQRVIQSN
uniref:N-acetyltransferase domain-containing protein n=1 Tax=Timspurckia oligopyrenoides TaxID=708627 RepID=A0A7S1ETD7_9RHOD